MCGSSATVKYDSVASVSPQDTIGGGNHFELVRKDSERQIIVLKVLKEQADKVRFEISIFCSHSLNIKMLVLV